MLRRVTARLYSLLPNKFPMSPHTNQCTDKLSTNQCIDKHSTNILYSTETEAHLIKILKLVPKMKKNIADDARHEKIAQYLMAALPQISCNRIIFPLSSCSHAESASCASTLNIDLDIQGIINV